MEKKLNAEVAEGQRIAEEKRAMAPILLCVLCVLCDLSVWLFMPNHSI
jgi:hypothetical protein